MSIVKKNAKKFIQDVFANTHNPTQSVLALLGAAVVTCTLWRWTKSIVKNFLLPGKDLVARYGKGSYAVITGGSEGLGRALGEELAAKGFNLVLLARNREKLELVQADIQKKFNIKVIVIQADFARSHEPEFWKVINDELDGLDISILINNVGIHSYGKQFVEFTDKEVLQNFNINCLSNVNMTRLLIDKMLKRANKGAIITVGSLAAYEPFPYYVPYSPSKAFSWYFSESNRKSYGDKLDIMCLNPAEIMTGFLPEDKAKTYHHIQAGDAAKAALSQLGRESTTEGHWRHQLYKYTSMLIPRWFLISMVRKNGPERLRKVKEYWEKKRQDANKLEVAKATPV